MNLPLSALLLVLLTVFAGTATSRPNIIVILSDDMGFSDLGCYGGEIRTPHLDALASGGIRCTQFYNTGRCCPTRASLLTGLHPHQAGIGHMTADRGHDGYRGVLNDRCVTIAEALLPAGYRTYMCGKWHVTRHNRPDSDRGAWPLQRGFEKFYGTIEGGGSFYDPTSLCRQNTFITPANDPDYRPESYYYTDALSDNAVRFLDQHRQESPDKPFFLYLAYTAAHWPLHAPESEVAKYKGRYDAGYDTLRRERLERMKALGLVPPSTTLTPAAADWQSVSDKAWETRCMEVYAAMVDRMDQGIGKVVAALRTSGSLENTLILYLQDNGGCAEDMVRRANGPAPGDLKPMAPDALQTQIWPPMQTRDGRWVRTGPGVMPGPPDTYVGYGKGWANVSNTPFREFKHWTHEGGISTPLIAHWPAGMPAAAGGRLVTEPGQLTDIMATCLSAARADYPPTHQGRKITPLEGRDLLPHWKGTATAALERRLFWEHEGNRAVREGRWKLVAKEDQPWELYDLETDRIEMNNLAASQPDRVKALAAAWDEWAARASVLPLGTWRGKAPAKSPAGAGTLRFELKADTVLERDQAPAIAQRGFHFAASMEGTRGVIVAQGGAAAGFTLYVEDEKLHFLVRPGGKQDVRRIDTPLPPGRHRIAAALSSTGVLSLQIDAQNPARSGPGPMISSQPVDGLTMSKDTGGLVGPYGESNAFNGTIETAILTLEPAKERESTGR